MVVALMLAATISGLSLRDSTNGSITEPAAAHPIHIVLQVVAEKSARREVLNTMIIGAILASLMLATGVAFLIGGLRDSGLIAPQPLELSSSRAEIGTLFLGVLVGAIVADDRHPLLLPPVSALIRFHGSHLRRRNCLRSRRHSCLDTVKAGD